MFVCDMCGREMPTEGSVEMLDGRIKCVDCRVEWLKSFIGFSEYWLKYKVQSVEGKKVNKLMIDRSKDQLKDAIKKQREIRQKRIGSSGKR